MKPIQSLIVLAGSALICTLFTACPSACVREIQVKPTVGIKGDASTDKSDVTFGGEITLKFDECISNPLLAALHELQCERRQLVNDFSKGRLTAGQLKALLDPLDCRIAEVVGKMGSAESKRKVASILPKPAKPIDNTGAFAALLGSPSIRTLSAARYPATASRPKSSEEVQRDLAAGVYATIGAVKAQRARLGLE